MPQIQRKCHCCKKYFLPAPKNRSRQIFCSEAACRRASKRRSQQLWQRKNPDYFRGPENVARVQRWRAEHPGYSRRQRAQTSAALQDFVPVQTTLQKSLGTNKAGPMENAAFSLQDFVHTQDPLVLGVVGTLLGDALQDNFEVLTRGLVERGLRLRASFAAAGRSEPANTAPL